jgi:hypothetical protein
MKRDMSLIAAAGALVLAPASVMAAPPSGSPAASHAQTTTAPTTTTPTTTPSTTGNGGGYNHANSPAHTTGQPSQSCETTGSPPGNSGTAPGSAFNQNGGTAGSNYAGEKPQNSRNTASVSQYDVACANQPH